MGTFLDYISLLPGLFNVKYRNSPENRDQTHVFPLPPLRYTIRHPLAPSVRFYNVYNLSFLVAQLQQEGHPYLIYGPSSSGRWRICL